MIIYLDKIPNKRYSELRLFMITGYSVPHKLRVNCPICTYSFTTFSCTALTAYDNWITCNHCKKMVTIKDALLKYITRKTIVQKIVDKEIFFETDELTLLI